MASMARPMLFRQPFNSLASKRASSAFLASTARCSAPLNRSPLQTFARDALPAALRVAAFHTTSRKSLLPALPQKIEGTVNDPAPVPPSSPTHGNYHWTFERLVSAGLVPLTIAPFAAGSLNPLMDAALCSMLLVHSYIGFEASIVDYFPVHRVPGVRNFLMWVLRGTTVAVGVALYSFETNDVGLTEALKNIWHA